MSQTFSSGNALVLDARAAGVAAAALCLWLRPLAAAVLVTRLVRLAA